MTNTITYVPAVGDRVIAREIPGSFPEYEGQEAVLTEILRPEDGYTRLIYRGEVQSRQKPDDTLNLSFYVAEPLPGSAPAPEATYTQAQYDEVVLQRDEARRLHNEWRSHAFEAVRIIGETLMQEAENRGWCSEYDGVVDEINASLPAGLALPVREQEYTVTWREQYTVWIDQYETVTARSAEDAIDAVKNGGYEGQTDVVQAIRDAAYSGAYDYSDTDSYSYEAEEA